MSDDDLQQEIRELRSEVNSLHRRIDTIESAIGHEAPSNASATDTLDSTPGNVQLEESISDILPRLKARASHPVLAGQVNPEGWESKVCWTVSQWLCHGAVTRTL